MVEFITQNFVPLLFCGLLFFLLTGIPVAFGVLTCDSLEQALERAGSKGGNKGWEAATSAIEMVDLLGKIK